MYDAFERWKGNSNPFRQRENAKVTKEFEELQDQTEENSSQPENLVNILVSLIVKDGVIVVYLICK